RGVAEWLEGGTGLAARLCRAIDVAAIEIAAAHQGAHLASRRIRGNERRLQWIVGRLFLLNAFQLSPFDLGQRFRNLRFGRFLHIEIDRRIHLQAALVDTLPSEALNQLLAYFFLEVLA